MLKKFCWYTVIIIIGLIIYYYKTLDLPSPYSDPAYIRIGTNAEYPPFSFINNAGEIVGVDIDIAKELIKRCNKKAEFIDMPFDALVPALQIGHIHMIAAGISPSKERANIIFFTDIYFNDPLVIVTNKNNGICNVNHLTNKTIIVNEGYTSDYYASSLANVNIIRLPSINEALLALESNRAEAFVSAESAINMFFKQKLSSTLCMYRIPNTAEQYAFGVSKKFPSLLISLKKAMTEIKIDGTLHRILAKWHLIMKS